MSNEQCEHRNKFCLVCGKFTTKDNGRMITKTLEDAYEDYFKMVIVKAWYIPEIVCSYCRLNLLKKPPKLKYALPMQWLPRTEHSANACYFCHNYMQSKTLNFKTRDKVNYVLGDSVIEPVKHSTEEASMDMDMDMNTDMDTSSDMGQISGQSLETASGTSGEKTPPGTFAPAEEFDSPPSAVDTSSTYVPDRRDLQMLDLPIKLTQKDVDNLAKDMKCSEKQKEILGSRLKDFRCVTSDFLITAGKKKKILSTRIKDQDCVALAFLTSSGRKRRNTQEYDEMFRTDEETKMTYCWNVRLLFLRMKQVHNPTEWRLFIDGGKNSLKAVLLHITNKYPSIPIAHGDKVAEKYESIGAILKLLQYEEYKWLICADLKIVAILMGLKQGYSKHQCFLCLWEGRKNDLHYDYSHKWPQRYRIQVGIASQEKEPLVRDRSKIILPPLHIKLGVVRNFTKALHRDSVAYNYLRKFMNKLGASDAKVENGKNLLSSKRKNNQNLFSSNFYAFFVSILRCFHWTANSKINCR